MIQSKRDLLLYLERDRKALCIKRKRPKLFADEVWRFEIVLRKLEYIENCRPYYGIINSFVALYYRYKYHSLSLKLGLSIPINTFGPGLAIVHYGTIVVAEGAVIGENCRIHEGVTIGATNGSSKAAKIGNNVFIGSGAKIIGDIVISDNVAIAANAVVVKDIIAAPSGCTVGGVPARMISENNSSNNLFSLT